MLLSVNHWNPSFFYIFILPFLGAFFLRWLQHLQNYIQRAKHPDDGVGQSLSVALSWEWGDFSRLTLIPVIFLHEASLVRTTFHGNSSCIG